MFIKTQVGSVAKYELFLIVSIILTALFAFSDVALAAGPSSVNLGMAGNFVILSKTGISTTGTTLVTGDIGVSPIAATAITGFGLVADSTNVFSTTPLVTGHVYAATYADPTPANLVTAIGDMQTAYTDAAGRTLPTATELGAGDISGLTITPGLYKWGTGVSINSDVTLSGGPNDVWIFQIAQGLTVASGKKVILSGGAQAKNVYWQVGSAADIGTNAQFNGIILAQTAISLHTGATLNGRALAQTAVTLDANAVTSPGTSSASPAPVVTPTPTPAPTPSIPTTNSPTPTPSPSQTPSGGGGAGLMFGTNGVVTVTPSVGTAPTSQSNANAPMIAALKAQLNVLLAKIGSSNGGMSTTGKVEFTRNLMLGSTGADVKSLQVYLNTHGYAVASSGAGSSGSESTTFGRATKAAMIKFQVGAGILPASGYFGAKSRAYIATH